MISGRTQMTRRTLSLEVCSATLTCCLDFPSNESSTWLPRLRAADTVVFSHAQPLTSDTSYSVLPDINQELLEKPTSKGDNFRMLLDMNGGVCEVVTGVTIGK